jgi:hypothetical protein
MIGMDDEGQRQPELSEPRNAEVRPLARRLPTDL